jgi:hypothetical protein
MDIMSQLMIAAAIILVIVAVAFAWEICSRAWYWAAAKVMGWDEHEKFMRETAYLDREGERIKRQQRKDAETDSADRRRMGAYLVAVVIGAIAWHVDAPWYGIALAVGATYLGLHMVGGVALKWTW